MKVLLCGYHNPYFLTITEYIERAIQKLGHSLTSFDDRAFVLPGRIRQKLNLLQAWDQNRINRKLLSLCSSLRPDLCLILGGHRIHPETVKDIKNCGIQTVLWTIDVPLDFQLVQEAAPHYDTVFCGGTEAQEVLAQAGISHTHWLPFASDPEIHKAEELTPEQKKLWGSDLAFVGSFYPHRALVLEKVSDFNLKIWGPGWNRLSPGSPLKGRVKDMKLEPEEWRKIYSSVKVNIVIHFQDGQTLSFQAAPKVYETMACQGFLLVDNQKDVMSLFEDGKHLVVYKDVQDLREKITYYLQHQEERERIARQGHEEVIEKHTYLYRLRQMFSVIGVE